MVVNNILFCYDREKHTGNDNERKQRFLQHKENHSDNKETYNDGSKSTERKVGFATVFADITRRSFHPHSSNDNNKNNNERDTKREDIRWAIYTDSLSPILAIENNRENHSILNQIYDILAELHNQEKLITKCKIPANIGINGNEETDKATKQAIDIQG